MEKFLNNYNIEIKQCCASCVSNLGAATEAKRICGAGHGSVSPSYCCEMWKAKIGKDAATGEAYRPNYQHAGKGTGRVKKLHYLHYLQECKEPNNPRYKYSIEQIRQDYEEQFGSIYI